MIGLGKSQLADRRLVYDASGTSRTEVGDYRFRRFCSGSLALASLDRACRDQSLDLSVTLTTTAFDRSSSRWLGISDLIAEPEGPSFISHIVVRGRLDRLHS